MNISEWVQNIQRLSSKFREAALQDCEDDERIGIVALADKLWNICFYRVYLRTGYRQMSVLGKVVHSTR